MWKFSFFRNSWSKLGGSVEAEIGLKKKKILYFFKIQACVLYPKRFIKYPLAYTIFCNFDKIWRKKKSVSFWAAKNDPQVSLAYHYYLKSYGMCMHKLLKVGHLFFFFQKGIFFFEKNLNFFPEIFTLKCLTKNLNSFLDLFTNIRFAKYEPSSKCILWCLRE